MQAFVPQPLSTSRPALDPSISNSHFQSTPSHTAAGSTERPGVGLTVQVAGFGFGALGALSLRRVKQRKQQSISKAAAKQLRRIAHGRKSQVIGRAWFDSQEDAEEPSPHKLLSALNSIGLATFLATTQPAIAVGDLATTQPAISVSDSSVELATPVTQPAVPVSLGEQLTPAELFVVDADGQTEATQKETDDAAPLGPVAPRPKYETASYGKLIQLVSDGAILDRVNIHQNGKIASVQVADEDGTIHSLVIDLPKNIMPLFDKLMQHHTTIDVHPPNRYQPSELEYAASLFLVFVWPFVLFYSLNHVMQKRMGLTMRAEARIVNDTGVKFSAVAGIDSAKAEVAEIVEFLKSPGAFLKVGATIPKGVLLSGPPGTGKTLLAKAIAGEAGVSFINTSAAEFTKVYVGSGSARVRDLFKKARDNQPCIIFIDEIDAVGQQRGSMSSRSSAEREQTLNQILCEMDGFFSEDQIIVLAATNRADLLDTALTRPGRFDRRIALDLPSMQGRHAILKVHAASRKIGEDVCLENVANHSAGFSGAQLENLINEAAMLAARRDKTEISQAEVDDAMDRVLQGVRNTGTLADTHSKKVLAYHHAGNALLSILIPENEDVRTVTMLPQTARTTVNAFLANDDGLISLSELKANVTACFGGRAAERLVYGVGGMTSAASGSLKRAEQVARAMVTQFGMSDLGSITIDERAGSDAQAASVDAAIDTILAEGYNSAFDVLSANRSCLDRVAEELMKNETLTGVRLREIVNECDECNESCFVVNECR